ncbi:ion transporter [candidate division KSB1 bacterium]
MAEEFSNLKERIRFYFDDVKTPMGKGVDIFLIIVNIIACIAFVYESDPTPGEWQSALKIAEIFLTTVFAVEYILRIWTAKKRAKYIFSLMGFIDLLSILPSVLAAGDFRFLRIFRVFRIFRFARFFKNHIFFFGEIKRVHLQVVRILFSLFSLVFVSSGLIYNIEKQFSEVKPESITSFFDAIYFSLVTITTVGFGDFVPLSEYGRIATLFIIILGIIILPWQVGLLIKELLSIDKKYIICTHCNLKYHDTDASYCRHCGNPLEFK